MCIYPSHYEDMPMSYTGFSEDVKFSSTHHLCFGAKIRETGIPLHRPVLLYKSEVQGGITGTCFRDEFVPGPYTLRQGFF